MQFGASTFIWTSPFSNAKLDLIDHTKALGFDIIEICVEDPATIDTGAILNRLKSTGMRATVCGAFGPDRDISAPSVVGPMYSAVGKTRMLEPSERQKQWRLAVENLQRAAAIADDHGVKLGLEPLNRFETDLVNTLDQGLRMVADVGHPDVGLLVDTFHMNIEEKDIPAALRAAAGHIVEFHACSSDRGTPGEDHLPWPEIVRALRDIHYDGPIVIEAFTPEIKEIARAVSIWRKLAESDDALASNGLRHLKAAFAA
jgi:D-psicose/D-tagatose/L-ribulose 3-epimerase